MTNREKSRKYSDLPPSENIIKYTSDNGYTGMLYGKSSLAIYDSNGIETMHTCHRSINTYEELVDMVEEHPMFMENLLKLNTTNIDAKTAINIFGMGKG